MPQLRLEVRARAGLFHRRDVHQLRRHRGDCRPRFFSARCLRGSNDQPTARALGAVRDRLPARFLSPCAQLVAGLRSFFQPRTTPVPRASEKLRRRLTILIPPAGWRRCRRRAFVRFHFQPINARRLPLPRILICKLADALSCLALHIRKSLRAARLI